MATLDSQTRSRLKEALTSCSSRWAIVGLADVAEAGAKLDGISGLIDWMLHGQVSRQLIEAPIAPGSCALFPGDALLGRPNFLFFQLSAKAKASSLLEAVRKLSIQELALAETTFPEDFSRQLKQNLEKDGIRWQRLEPIADDNR